MVEPRLMSPGSLMPPYPWLADDKIDFNGTPAKIRAMKKLGVPYTDDSDLWVTKDMTMQAEKIITSLAEAGITVEPDKKIVALIAYLQRMGTDIKVETETGQ